LEDALKSTTEAQPLVLTPLGKRIQDILSADPSKEGLRSALGVSPETMRVYLANLYPVFGVHNFEQLVLRVCPKAHVPLPGKRFKDILSPAELEIAKLIGQGFSTKEIAEQRNVEDQTIRNMLVPIRKKTGTRSRVELALAARNEFPRPTPRRHR